MQNIPHALVEYAIPLSVQSQIAQNNAVIQRTERYTKELKNNATFAAKVAEQSPGNARQIWVQTGSELTLHIYFPVPGFTVEAAPRLAHLLEFISEFYENPPSSGDYPNGGSRDYFFYPLDSENAPSIHISATLEDNAENCQRIIVGTEKRKSYQLVETTEPVYAFKC